MTGLTLAIFTIEAGVHGWALQQYGVGGPSFRHIRSQLETLSALNGLLRELNESQGLVCSLLSGASPDRVQRVRQTHDDLDQGIHQRFSQVLESFPLVEDRVLLDAARESWETHALAVQQSLDVPGGIPPPEALETFVDGLESRRHARIVAQVESTQNALRLHIAALEQEVQTKVTRLGWGLRGLEAALFLVLLVSFVRISRSILEPVQLQGRLVTHEALRADTVSALSGTDEQPAALQRCTQSLVEGLDAAYAGVWTLGDGGQHLELAAHASQLPHLSERAPARCPPGEGCLGRVAQTQEPCHTNEMAGQCAGEPWTQQEGVVSCTSQPLVVGKQLLGVLVVLGKRPFPRDTVDTLKVIADSIAQGLKRRSAEQALAKHAGELARSNADLERFAYVASHDLQEPLRTVASYAQLLVRRYRGKLDQAADEYIGFMVDGATRMKSLIDDLLAYSRISSRPGERTLTDCGELVRRVLPGLKQALHASDVELVLEPLPVVEGDGGQLHQLFQNLLGNALKFRHPDRPLRIRVAAQRQPDHWVFSVEDNGIGIDPQYFERIFIIFQRLHSKAEYPGTGIGLALCKRIVEHHGGRIWVESTPGGGSTFRFSLPASSKPDATRLACS